MHNTSSAPTIEARVVAELQRRGVSAYYEYPGVVHVPEAGGSDTGFWTSGHANPTWTVDLQEAGHVLHTYDTGIPGTSTDVAAITDAVQAILCKADAVADDDLIVFPDGPCENGHDFDSAQNLDGGRCRRCGVAR